MNNEDAVATGVFLLAIAGMGYWLLRTTLQQRRQKRAPLADLGVGKIGSEDQSTRASRLKPYPVTVALITISVVIAVMSNLGSSSQALLPLLITGLDNGGLTEIRGGQVWRLLTPAFIHFGPLHLLLNMMWLWDLGRLLEKRRGTWFFGGMVVALGIVSNLAQYELTGSPYFGGMSGVVYGLLGYTWMQGRHNQQFGFVLHKQTVITMLGWFVLCWTGILGPIANWAHTTGLCAGAAWGYLKRDEARGSSMGRQGLGD
ncbi:MAG: rhomboid family intramembrane serine protease [Bacteroidota bacterium]